MTVTWYDIRTAYPARPDDQRWGEAQRKYEALLEQGHTAESILYSIQSYKRYCDATGITGTGKVKQARFYFTRTDYPGGRRPKDRNSFLIDWDERIPKELK